MDVNDPQTSTDDSERGGAEGAEGGAKLDDTALSSPSPPGVTAAPAFHVFVVDDAQFDLECISAMCDDHGFEVSAFSDWRVALAALERDDCPADMVMVDYHQGDSFDAVAFMRAMQRLGRPTVAMSGDNSLRVISECLREELAADFFVKPVAVRDVARLPRLRSSRTHHDRHRVIEGAGAVAGAGRGVSEGGAYRGRVLQARNDDFHILVIDDNPFDAACIAQMCSHERYSAARAHSADEADVAMARKKPDLVLLDWHMPGFDARGFLRTLKARRVTAVVISGDKCNQHIADAVATGLAADFLPKPLQQQSLSALPKYKEWAMLSALSSGPQEMVARASHRPCANESSPSQSGAVQRGASAAAASRGAMKWLGLPFHFIPSTVVAALAVLLSAPDLFESRSFVIWMQAHVPPMGLAVVLKAADDAVLARHMGRQKTSSSWDQWRYAVWSASSLFVFLGFFHVWIASYDEKEMPVLSTWMLAAPACAAFVRVWKCTNDYARAGIALSKLSVVAVVVGVLTSCTSLELQRFCNAKHVPRWAAAAPMVTSTTAVLCAALRDSRTALDPGGATALPAALVGLAARCAGAAAFDAATGAGGAVTAVVYALGSALAILLAPAAFARIPIAGMYAIGAGELFVCMRLLPVGAAVARWLALCMLARHLFVAAVLLHLGCFGGFSDAARETAFTRDINSKRAQVDQIVAAVLVCVGGIAGPQHAQGTLALCFTFPVITFLVTPLLTRAWPQCRECGREWAPFTCFALVYVWLHANQVPPQQWYSAIGLISPVTMWWWITPVGNAQACLAFLSSTAIVFGGDAPLPPSWWPQVVSWPNAPSCCAIAVLTRGAALWLLAAANARARTAWAWKQNQDLEKDDPIRVLSVTTEATPQPQHNSRPFSALGHECCRHICSFLSHASVREGLVIEGLSDSIQPRVTAVHLLWVKHVCRDLNEADPQFHGMSSAEGAAYGMLCELTGVALQPGRLPHGAASWIHVLWMFGLRVEHEWECGCEAQGASEPPPPHYSDPPSSRRVPRCLSQATPAAERARLLATYDEQRRSFFAALALEQTTTGNTPPESGAWNAVSRHNLLWMIELQRIKNECREGAGAAARAAAGVPYKPPMARAMARVGATARFATTQKLYKLH